MSNENLLKQDLLVAPADSDERFISRLEYEDPIRQASIWLHKLIIHRLRDVQLAAPWYRGETNEPATAAEVKTAVESIVAALAKSHPAKQQRKRQADWRKDDPAVLKRRDDTKRVLAEIRKRHKATSVSYVKIIDSMRRDPVWGARMRHMNAESWRSEVIKSKRH